MPHLMRRKIITYILFVVIVVAGIFLATQLEKSHITLPVPTTASSEQPTQQAPEIPTNQEPQQGLPSNSYNSNYPNTTPSQ